MPPFSISCFRMRLVAQITRRIHALFFVVADSREVSILQHMKQFGLQAGVEFGDFIQEKRAVFRHLDAAGFRGRGAGERAFFKTEKLAFQQRSGNSRAVHFYKRAIAPRRAVVNEARQNFFAGAAFAQNQYRNIQRGGAIDSLPNCLHRFGRTKVNVVRRQIARVRRRRIRF